MPSGLGEVLPLLHLCLCVCVFHRAMVKTGWEHRGGTRVPGPALGTLLSAEYGCVHTDMAGRANRACSSWVTGHW